MLSIALHLHAYQPPTQPQRVLDQIYYESYEPLLNAVETHHHISFSLDLAKSLGERLPNEFLKRLKILFQAKRIELVNTAAYHYLLPLFPDRVIERQLDLNRTFYERYLTDDEPIPGVFPPELAFSPRLPFLLKNRGCSWIMADDGPFVFQRRHMPSHLQTPFDWIPTMGECGCLLRSRMWSEQIADGKYKNGAEFFHKLIRGLKKWGEDLGNIPEGYMILAVDFETFGHHYKNAIKDFLIPFFEEMNTQPNLYCITSLQNIWERFKKTPAYIPEGSWVTSEEHFKNNIPYPLWNYPGNQFHFFWNTFIKGVLSIILFEDTLDWKLINLCDRAFYSCSPWWYSHANKDVACWCLPLFQEIIDCISPEYRKKILQGIHDELQSLCI